MCPRFSHRRRVTELPELWTRLCSLVETNGGLLFTFNSIYLADGSVLVGPMGIDLP